MKSPEFITHGTSSEKDAEQIKKDGFEALEGRATVSADLIYAFDWATNKDRRRSSKSEATVKDEDVGRIVIMKTPANKTVDYATQTDINVSEKEKEVTGYSSKYKSGRRQLAIYPETVIKNKHPEKTKVDRENILISIVPTEELERKLNEVSRDIKDMRFVDLEQYTAEITELIKKEPENFFAPSADIEKTIQTLLKTTLETEVVNKMRSLSMDVKRAQGYSVYNRGRKELKEKYVDKQALIEKLKQIHTIVNKKDFDIGMDTLNRYIKANISRLLSELT